MKPKKETAPRETTALARKGSPVPAIAQVATEIRGLIETARRHVSVTANLALVNLYWNIGRIITQEMQRDETRAAYGEKLVEQLGSILSRDYGSGFSARNLWDMKRFFGAFQILPPLSAEFTLSPICSTLSDKSAIRQTASAGSAVAENCQPAAGNSLSHQIVQTASGQSQMKQILQTLSAESSEQLQIDFRRHFRLGWSHYRLLLAQSDLLCRQFYFEQAAEQRWTVRELRRQIDRGLFERVALSRNTPRLMAQEKRAGPTEIVRYEDIFKDPYVLDFLGLKGAYSEKDLEAAIVRNLEQFLTELGTDFCFIGRQYAMRIDDDDYALETDL